MTLNSKKEEYLIYKLADNMKNCIKIDADLFRKLDVKRGLRNEDGTGVLVGLTNIGNVVGYERTENGLKPIEGKLYFRGYEISDLVHAVLNEQRFGFEEIAYLLLSGGLPDARNSSNSATCWLATCRLCRKPCSTSWSLKAPTS